MIRLEAPARPCPQPGCNGKCGYLNLDLSGLTDFVKPRRKVDLHVGFDSDLARAPKLRAVISDTAPVDHLLEARAIREGTIDEYASEPCSAWREFIHALYLVGYRWFWFERDESPSENEVKTA